MFRNFWKLSHIQKPEARLVWTSWQTLFCASPLSSLSYSSPLSRCGVFFDQLSRLGMLSAEFHEQDAVCSHPCLVKFDKEKKKTYMWPIFLNPKNLQITHPEEEPQPHNKITDMSLLGMEAQGRREAEQVSCPCSTALLAFLFCGIYKRCCSHSAYRNGFWHPLYVLAAELELFLFNLGDKNHQERAALWPGSCQSVILMGIPQGNLFLVLLPEWQQAKSPPCFVPNRLELEPAASSLLTSVSFRSGSKLIPMGGG